MLTRSDHAIAAAAVLLLAGCGSGAGQPGSSASRPDPPAHAGPQPSAVAPPRWKSDPERVRAADYSILFVGNSHTMIHDIPNLVCRMIAFRHSGKTTYSHHVGVGFLEDTARHPACREEIESRPWKHVVLQAQKISVSGKFNYSRKEGLEIAKLAKGRGASVVFYPEWGLQGVEGDGARQEKVYREMARESGVGLAPVARAWDLALAERPDLELHSGDGNHQSALGAFLTAAVLCGRITGDSPAGLASFPYEEGTEVDRKFLAEVAARTLELEEKDPR